VPQVIPDEKGDPLIPLTADETRRLFNLHTRITRHERCSHWRRRHQARARQCHYRRRDRESRTTAVVPGRGNTWGYAAGHRQLAVSVPDRARSAGAFVVYRAGWRRAWLSLPGRVQVRNHLGCTASVARCRARLRYGQAGPHCSVGAITSAGPGRVLRPGGHQCLIPAGLAMPWSGAQTSRLRSAALQRGGSGLLQPDGPENALMRVFRSGLSGLYRSSIAALMATLSEGSQQCRLDTRRLSL
jgi:hypothetical protein